MYMYINLYMYIHVYTCMYMYINLYMHDSIIVSWEVPGNQWVVYNVLEFTNNYLE